MNSILRNTRIQLTLLLTVAALCAYILWSYILSFQTVVFVFDQKLGYIELSTSDQKLYPTNNQPIKLRKGVYTARNIGTSIAQGTRQLTIDTTSQTIHIEFDYTKQYLDTLYAAQQDSIESVLHREYPSIEKYYRLENSRLYHHGEIYGTSLIAIDQSGDNADTLHVIMQKKEGSWRLVSRPPAPILSAPNYPGIDVAILRSINQGK